MQPAYEITFTLAHAMNSKFLDDSDVVDSKTSRQFINYTLSTIINKPYKVYIIHQTISKLHFTHTHIYIGAKSGHLIFQVKGSQSCTFIFPDPVHSKRSPLTL